MKIQEIYDKYKIMPQLQLHQLKVAGVASIICDNFQKNIDKDSVITACLLHDIGSIANPTFKVDLVPDHVKPQGKKYWVNIQKKFSKKYGPDDHKATFLICKELNVANKVTNFIESISFRETESIYKNSSFELKITTYSDNRVALRGVKSLQQRLEEAKERYLKKKKGKYTLEEFQKYIPMWNEIEKQIFYHTTISPEDITDRGVMRLIPKLRDYNIKIS